MRHLNDRKKQARDRSHMSCWEKKQNTDESDEIIDWIVEWLNWLVTICLSQKNKTVTHCQLIFFLFDVFSFTNLLIVFIILIWDEKTLSYFFTRFITLFNFHIDNHVLYSDSYSFQWAKYCKINITLYSCWMICLLSNHSSLKNFHFSVSSLTNTVDDSSEQKWLYELILNKKQDSSWTTVKTEWTHQWDNILSL